MEIAGSGDLDMLRRLEEAGIAAVMLPSLFEEQITQESEMLDGGLSYGEESFACPEAQSL